MCGEDFRKVLKGLVVFPVRRSAHQYPRSGWIAGGQDSVEMPVAGFGFQRTHFEVSGVSQLHQFLGHPLVQCGVQYFHGLCQLFRC